MLSFSKLPTRRLQEVKGKTLMRWHIKIIHINVNKLFRSSSQDKFRKSSHSIWTQCAQLFVRTLDLHPHVEEHLLKILAQRSKLSPRVKHIASASDINCGKKTTLLKSQRRLIIFSDADNSRFVLDFARRVYNLLALPLCCLTNERTQGGVRFF